MNIASLSQYEDGDFFALLKKVDNNVRVGITTGDPNCVLHSDGFFYRIMDVSDTEDRLARRKRLTASKFEVYLGVIRTRTENRKRVFDIVSLQENFEEGKKLEDIESYFSRKQREYSLLNDINTSRFVGYTFVRRLDWQGENIFELNIKRNPHTVSFDGKYYDVFLIYYNDVPSYSIAEEFLNNGYELAKVEILKEPKGGYEFHILKIM